VAFGEIAGMVIATAVGLGNAASIVLAIVLAFLFGYALTIVSLRPIFSEYWGWPEPRSGSGRLVLVL
jgi:Domain of unknown function (DUF4396)